MQGSEKEGPSRKKGQPEQMQKQDLGSYPVSVFGGFGICLWAFKKKLFISVCTGCLLLCGLFSSC